MSLSVLAEKRIDPGAVDAVTWESNDGLLCFKAGNVVACCKVPRMADAQKVIDLFFELVDEKRFLKCYEDGLWVKLVYRRVCWFDVARITVQRYTNVSGFLKHVSIELSFKGYPQYNYKFNTEP